jgi:hypothetical protein
MQSTEPVPKTRPRLQLSATQLIASALAAVTTTIAASFLGINGTVIGAAVASVLTVAGNAIYSHSIHRTRERVRTAVPAVTWRSVGTAPTELLPDQPQPWQQPAATTTASATATTTATTSAAAGATPGWSDATTARRPRQRRLRRLGFATVGVFVAILAALTSAELVAGRPISDLLQGKSSSGTSVTSVLGSQSGSRSSSPGTSSPTPVTTVTQTVVPKVVTATPTVTQTAPAVTVTPAATTTRTAAPTTPASPAATPTAPASASPTGSTTP